MMKEREGDSIERVGNEEKVFIFEKVKRKKRKESKERKERKEKKKWSTLLHFVPFPFYYFE